MIVNTWREKFNEIQAKYDANAKIIGEQNIELEQNDYKIQGLKQELMILRDESARYVRFYLIKFLLCFASLYHQSRVVKHVLALLLNFIEHLHGMHMHLYIMHAFYRMRMQSFIFSIEFVK